MLYFDTFLTVKIMDLTSQHGVKMIDCYIFTQSDLLGGNFFQRNSSASNSVEVMFVCRNSTLCRCFRWYRTVRFFCLQLSSRPKRRRRHDWPSPVNDWSFVLIARIKTGRMRRRSSIEKKRRADAALREAAEKEAVTKAATSNEAGSTAPKVLLAGEHTIS